MTTAVGPDPWQPLITAGQTRWLIASWLDLACAAPSLNTRGSTCTFGTKSVVLLDAAMSIPWQGVSVSAGKNNNNNNNVCHREAERGKSVVEADQTQLKMACFFLLFSPPCVSGSGQGKISETCFSEAQSTETGEQASNTRTANS